MSFPGPNQPPSNGGGNKPNGGSNPFTNPFGRNNNAGNGNDSNGKGDKSNGNGSNGGPRPFWQSPWLWVVVVALLAVTMFQLFAGAGSQTIDTKDGMQILNGNTVEYATIVDNTQQVKLKLSSDYSATDPDTGRTKNYGKNVQFYYTYAQSAAVVKAVQKADPAKGWTASMQQTSIWTYLLTSLLPFLIIFGLFWFLMSRMGGAGGMLGMGGKKNSGKLLDGQTPTTKFSDVAGEDAAVQEVEEIKDFLKDPSRYKALGARIPRGVLLYGPPGTGKTLLARAIAGEAGVPFYSMAGSDFVEMFVGLGASRVRDLFDEAKKNAPAIIFIDEIDAVGRKRGSGMGGGHDEREQTLNQLLAELDGFDPSKGVIVLGATNRPEVLDKALLRPGRFDRRITVDRPNLAGRLATLQVHTRNIRLAEDVDLNKIAQATAGCVGADLANLVNEAALRAVRKGRKAVNQNDLLVSFELVIAGSEKKGTVITEEEKRIIAYHEVGHALVAAKQKNAQPVSKITIVPHTQGALGYTLHLPEEEKFLMSREDILTEIRTLLAGRSSEEIVCNTMTSGAANDIERATELARNLVARFGMCDEFDMMALGTIQSQYLDGSYSMTCAQETYAAADRETIKIIRQCHQEAKRILQDNRELLDKIAAYLLKKETITGQEMMAIIEGRDPETVDNYGATREQERKLFRPSVPETIEAPAKHINMVSEPVPMPDFDAPEEEPAKASEPPAPEEAPGEGKPEGEGE